MDLTRLASTALYAPPAGPRFMFLLWDAASATGTIPLADTWADEGEPASAGWYVFVPGAVQAADAVALESDLRAGLTTNRGLAWAAPKTATAVFELLGHVSLELDASKRPAVTRDAPITTPKGMPQLGFIATLQAQAVPTSPEPSALGFADPAGQAIPGIQVALTSATSGCVTFEALQAAQGTPDRSVKSLAAVQIDPLNPYDPQRSRITPLGVRYALTRSPQGGYTLQQVTA